MKMGRKEGNWFKEREGQARAGYADRSCMNRYSFGRDVA